MSDRPEDPGLPERPPAPPASTAAGTLDLTSETSVRSGGIAGRVVAGALGVALLVGGVAFAATQAGSEGGASDPEAAVRQMFDAIAAEDVLGVIGTLDPDERNAIAGPVEELFEELERLEVLDDSFELDGISGIDLEFEDLAFRTEAVRDDLVRVHLTGGTASYAVDTDEIPVGDFLVDAFDRFGVEYPGTQESDSEVLDPEQTGDTFLVARDTGDGWRISLGYTAVEAARMGMDAGIPVAGAGLEPIGAGSPEEAVEGFLQAAAAIDVEGAVARLSPGELRAVHDYWPVLADAADLPTPEDVDAQIELTDLELRSEIGGDRAQVFVDRIGVDVVAEDFVGGGTIAGGCIEVRGDVRERFEDEDVDLPEGPICEDDIESILEDVTGEADLGTGLGPFGMLGGLGGLGLGDGETQRIGITTVRVDGEWFVAPLGTFTELGLTVLETVQRQDLDAMIDAVEELSDGFTGGFSTDFEELEDLQEMDDLGSWEESEDAEASAEPFDDPTPDQGFSEAGGAAAGPAGEKLLRELLAAFTSDPAVVECTLGELYASATSEQVYGLADAQQYDFEPSPDTQEVLLVALEACGG